MRVETSNVINNVQNVDKKIQSSGKDFEFTLLSKISDSNLKEKLEGLLSEIEEKGNILAKKVNLKEFKEYRKKVSEFMNEVVSNSHEFSRESFLNHRGRQKTYGIIKKVNTNLDDMAKAFIEKQEKNINVLEKIDEVKGLLLDIFM